PSPWTSAAARISASIRSASSGSAKRSWFSGKLMSAMGPPARPNPSRPAGSLCKILASGAISGLELVPLGHVLVEGIPEHAGHEDDQGDHRDQAHGHDLQVARDVGGAVQHGPDSRHLVAPAAGHHVFGEDDRVP